MPTWLSIHWFEIVQAVGIISSLLITAAAFRFDTRVRQTEIHMLLTQSHRAIWEKILEQPELNRIFQAKIDLKKSPAKPEEKRLVNLVIMHAITTQEAIRKGVLHKIPGFEDDMRAFLSLPIPRETAIEMLDFQTPANKTFLSNMIQ
jgi:hypothetical protein